MLTNQDTKIGSTYKYNYYYENKLLFQGVHTMLPISWPVSVVLAVLLSIIHLSYRIASNAHSFPILFLEQVMNFIYILKLYS